MIESAKNEEKKQETRALDYAGYRALGGIINEEDFSSALARAKDAKPDKFSANQIMSMAKRSGIELSGDQDERAVLYGVLRSGVNAEAGHHHNQMSDQRLFAEALRMLGDNEGLEKLKTAYPNIDFN